MKQDSVKSTKRNICTLLVISVLAGSAFGAEVAIKEAPPEVPAQAGAEEQPLPTRDTLSGDWWGTRSALQNRGLSLEGNMTAEISKNIRGGANTERITAQYLLNISLTIDTEKLAGWQGGTFFANFQHTGGTDPSTDVGDAQGLSSLGGGERTQLSEIWFRQSLFAGQELMWFKLGKIDVNSDFAFLDAASEFINGGMGLPVSDDILPTYPDAAFGAELFLTPVPWFYAGGGVFDGALAEGMRTGLNGPKSLFASPSDLYLIGEIGFLWDIAGYNGTLKTGLRYNTGTFERHNGSQQSGSAGGYVLGEQKIWRFNPDDKEDARGMSLFAGIDWADEDVSTFGLHYSAGLSINGPISSRPDDVLGFGFSSARFSRADGSPYRRESELALESFYRVQVTPWLSVKPDLQYIINPGGETAYNDALVATVRIEVTF